MMIEKYSRPGDLVLDPMGGSGATLLAALMGRQVCIVELEEHFILPMKASWAKMQQHPMLGYTMGQAVILRGDARKLPLSYELCGHCGKPKKPSLPLCSADAVLTSPPWEDRTALQDSQWLYLHESELAERFRQSHIGEKGLPGNTKPENRSTMEGYTRPAAIVTSPPYGHDSEHDQALTSAMREPPGTSKTVVYGITTENIGNQRGGALAALLVYNRLKYTNEVTVNLCVRCLPAKIAESLSARTTLGVSPVATKSSAKNSKGGPEAAVSTTARIVQPRLLAEASVVESVQLKNGVGGPKVSPSPLNGGLVSGPLIETSPSQTKQEQRAFLGREEPAHGEVTPGESSAGWLWSATDADAPPAGVIEVWSSTISRIESKLEANGITASITSLRSVEAAITEPTLGRICILCNASLADLTSSLGAHAPSVVLHLLFATPSIAPQFTLAGLNRKGDYWSSMNSVYAECWRVLRPGGILALVLKGFTRDGLYVDLPGQTEALLLAAGWEKHDHLRRELWSLSFWRILQKRRDPAAFDDRLNFEEVLAFRKPEGAGDGVAAVLTSPPYANRVDDHGVDQEGWDGFSERFGRYTRPSTIITSPPYEGIVGDNKEGPSQTSVPGGWKAGTVNKHGGYTQPQAIITSPPYEGSLQGEEPHGKLFETERRVNSPASGNRRSKRKPLGHGYTR